MVEQQFVRVINFLLLVFMKKIQIKIFIKMVFFVIMIFLILKICSFKLKINKFVIGIIFSIVNLKIFFLNYLSILFLNQ